MVSKVKYKAEVLEVHSGDDITVLVDLGIDDLYKKVRCRLLGVDTPSAFNAKEGDEAISVKKTVQTRLSQRIVIIVVHKMNKSSWLVDMLIPGLKSKETKNLNQLLIDLGYTFSKPQNMVRQAKPA